MARILFLLCVAVMALPARAGDVQHVPMQLAKDRDTMELGFGTCQWLYPHDGPVEKLIEAPGFRSPVYYSAHFGDSADSSFTLVIDKSGLLNSKYDQLYVDANNDNRITKDEGPIEFGMSTVSKEVQTRITFMVTSGGKTIPYSMNFTAFPYSDENNPVKKIHANLRNGSFFIGEAAFGGEKVPIAIADLNSNGLFNNTELSMFRGDRVFIDFNRDGKFDGEHAEGFPYSKYTKVLGKWYSISALPSGTELTVAAAEPKLGNVASSKQMKEALLSSDAQRVDLDFTSGTVEAVAGKYRLREFTLADSKDGKNWQLRVMPQETTVAEIPESATLKLDDELPCRVEAVASINSEKPGAIQLGTKITGRNGARCEVRGGSPDDGKLGIDVIDEKGVKVASATFEYG